MKLHSRHQLLLILISGLASSCGGGGSGGDSDNSGSSGQSSTIDWESGVFEAASEFKSFCENPRSGSDFDDLSGSTLDENNWLRSWTNETYLWYDEVIDRNPSFYSTADYFDLLKVTTLTASGADKDQFHFTYDSEEWEQLSQSGVSAGYGFQEALISDGTPNEIVIVYVEPDTPASDAGLSRGDQILSIDGYDIAFPSDADIEGFVAGISPDEAGETHTFIIQSQDGSSTQEVELVSEFITSTPVLATEILPTGSGDVGYILFNDHIATSEQQLINAVDTLSENAVTDLILDLRYNGGGLLAIASQMAYMIAGETATNGQTFELLTFNDKHPVFNPVTGDEITPFPFFSETLGFSTNSGDDLPSLNLERVFILATGNTCSASEAIINSLRGIDVEVILIGDTTCGKPYGFYPTENCGTTYFSIQFRGENADGFGDYAEGFTPAELNATGPVSVPGCAVDDDFSQELGNENEAMLAKALEYQATGSCDSPVTFAADTTISQKTVLPTAKALVQKSPWLQNRDMSLPNE